VLIISAHWESNRFDQIRVTCPATEKHPSLLYDYGGFPAYTYKLKYDCPSAPDVAQKVKEHLGGAGIDCVLDSVRNLDHGVFVPLSLMLPEASVPVL